MDIKALIERMRAMVRPTLRPIESKAIEAWRQRLTPEARRLLDAQMTLLRKYQRHPQGLHVMFFHFRSKAGRPPPRLPEDILFPCRLEWGIVARVSLVVQDNKGRGHNIRAEVILQNGELAAIEFNKPTKKLDGQEVSVKDVRVLRDPMAPTTEEQVPVPKRTQDVLASIHGKLPEEYLEMAAQGAPPRINDWQVYAPKDIWKHPGADGYNYYLLAEKDAVGWVCVREDDESGQIYLLDYDDACAEKIRCGFRSFLEGSATAS